MSKHLRAIREVARYQQGIFARFQVDVPDQTLHYHTQTGRLERLETGIYWLTDMPLPEDAEYLVAYLWARGEGVLSHETALNIYELSDQRPHRVHLTVPEEWRERNRVIPDLCELHYADLDEAEIQWHDAVRMTTVERTIKDIALSTSTPAIVEQAMDQALERGLVVEDIERRLLHFLIIFTGK
jgi:predicted transcriptional regulator of viral defense system